MTALADIVVRNSITLIDFIERIQVCGDSNLADASIKAGAFSLRPTFINGRRGYVRSLCHYIQSLKILEA